MPIASEDSPMTSTSALSPPPGGIWHVPDVRIVDAIRDVIDDGH
jgi:hypothetical protein